MTKSFVVVAAIFILVGGSIGGAFTGGVILGRNQAESEAPAAANFVPPEGFSSDQAATSATDGRSVVPGRRSKPECVGDIGQEYRGDGEPDVSVGCPRREPRSARLRGQRGRNSRWRRTGRLCRVRSRPWSLRRGRNFWNHRFHRRRRRSHQHSLKVRWKPP